MTDKAAWILIVGTFLIIVVFRLSSPYEQCVIAHGYTTQATRTCGEISVDVDATMHNGADPFS
jgi:hypothetical protein